MAVSQPPRILPCSFNITWQTFPPLLPGACSYHFNTLPGTGLQWPHLFTAHCLLNVTLPGCQKPLVVPSEISFVHFLAAYRGYFHSFLFLQGPWLWFPALCVLASSSPSCTPGGPCCKPSGSFCHCLFIALSPPSVLTLYLTQPTILLPDYTRVK